MCVANSEDQSSWHSCPGVPQCSHADLLSALDSCLLPSVCTLHHIFGMLCSHFQQVFRVTLAHGTQVLAKDFLLVSFAGYTLRYILPLYMSALLF